MESKQGETAGIAEPSRKRMKHQTDWKVSPLVSATAFAVSARANCSRAYRALMFSHTLG